MSTDHLDSKPSPGSPARGNLLCRSGRGEGIVSWQTQHLRSVAPSGVQTWLCLVTCGVTWTWRHVALLAHVVSNRHVINESGAATHQTLWPMLRDRRSPGVARCGVRTRRRFRDDVSSPDMTSERGVRRQAPSTHVASLDVASVRGVSGLGLPGTCFQNVSSVVG